MNIIEGTVDSPNISVAIVIARFNSFINNNLLKGALDVLKRIGQLKDENITVIWVPGAYELPIIIRTLVKTNKYDAIIALGTVIRGSTAHFEYITSSICNALVQISQEFEIPITFGILTTENIEQAIERAGAKVGNKGAEAALAALEVVNILKLLSSNFKR